MTKHQVSFLLRQSVGRCEQLVMNRLNHTRYTIRYDSRV